MLLLKVMLRWQIVTAQFRLSDLDYPFAISSLPLNSTLDSEQNRWQLS